MISFTLSKGEIVLSPEIVLFGELNNLYKMKDKGEKLLRTVYYMHSTEEKNPFSSIDEFVKEESVFMAVFKVKSLEDLKLSKKEMAIYTAAADLYERFIHTPESRMNRSIDKKLDEISRMLDETVPTIEETVTKTGEVKFNSNLTIILSMFTKVEQIMKAKSTLQSVIAKQGIKGKRRGGGKSSFLEKGLL